MYCTTCGKQIIDTARFCNYCGAPVVGANFTAPGTPTPITAPSTPSAAVSPSTTNESAPVSVPIENAPVTAAIENTPVSAPVSEPSQNIDNSESLVEDKETSLEAEAASSSSDSSHLDEGMPPIEPQTIADNDNESLGQIQPENTQTTAYTEVSEVQMPPQPTASNIETGNVYSLPAPNQIPMNGEGDVHIAEIPEKSAKPLPERKYTLGHIMLCLGAVAIMAIVAGVFAGLYFSVV